MTVKEWAIKHLVDNGMFETQANEVFERFAALEESEPMQDRWNDTADGYPDPMMAILRLGLNAEAVRWIDEKLPQAFFRPMFDGTA